MKGNNKKVAAILIVKYRTGNAFIERSEQGVETMIITRSIKR